MRRALPLLLSALAALFVSCGEDDIIDDNGDSPALPRSTSCSPACPSNLACFDVDGQARCLETNCGTDRCALGASCVSGECRFQNVTCNPTCGTGSHCVAGKCVPNYTDDNVCDPLSVCRELCGLNASCQAACENDQSASCTSCLSTAQSCGARDNCTPNASDCCQSAFCRCFPNEPGCPGVKPCDRCDQLYANDDDAFERCVADEPFCSSCLVDYQGCVASKGEDDPECRAKGCACISDASCN